MSNTISLIGAITALVTALGTAAGIILHIRNHDVKSQASTQQPPSANENVMGGTSQPANRQRKPPRIRRPRSDKSNRPYRS